MYKQTLSLLLILTWLALLPPVLAHDQPTTIELTPAEHAWLAAHPDIRLGIDKNWIPYVKSQDNGNIDGVGPDLMARINALTGANIRLVLGQWSDIVKQAEHGELEGLAFSSPNPEREAHFLFSSTLFNTTRYIYTRSDKISALHSMTDLAGKKVGIQTASLANQKTLSQWPSITQVSKKSISDLAVALLNGEVDGVIGNIATRQWLQIELITGIEVAFSIPNSETQVVYSIRKEHPELLSIINKAIAAIGPAEIQQILAKWSVNYETTVPKLALTEAEQAWLATHPDIRLGIDKGWIPYVKLQANGNIVGVAPDLFARIKALTGANIRLVLGQWTDLVKQAERGDLAGLAFSTAQPEREAQFRFSSPMLTSFRYIYTRSDKISSLRSMSDLAGKKVGLQIASITNQNILNQWPSIIQVPKESTNDLAGALLKGEVDAVIAISAVRQWLQTDWITGIDVAFAVPNSETPVVSTIRKEYPELLSIINKALAAIGLAEIQQLVTKWSANEAPVTKVVFTEAEQAWLQQHPNIILGISDQFQPEVIINPDGSYTGLIGDYFKALNPQLGNRLQLHVESNWNAITAKAIQHEIDGLASSTPNPTWDKYFLYSQPYSHAYLHLYTRTDSPAVTGLAALAGKRIGYLAGIKKIEYLLQQVPNLTRVGLNSNEALAKALLEGRVEVVMARIDLEWWRRQNSNLAIKIAGLIPESRHPVVMSIRNDWPLLPGILNKALNNIPILEQEHIRQRWLGGSAAAPQGQVLLSVEERAYLKDLTLQRAIPANWMPFNFKDKQGAYMGISEDYWALIRDKLGLHETITGVQPFPDILQALQQDKLDLLISTTRVKEREDYLVFSDSYEQYPLAIATRESTGFLANATALEGKIVAVGKDYSAYYLLKARYPAIQLLPVQATATALQQVATGQAFAAVDILPALQYQLAQFHGHYGHDLMLAGVTEVQFPLQIAVRKAHARLIPLINSAIATISPQERLNIQQKWMQQSVITTPDYTLLWQLTGVALLIIGMVLYWNRRLAREIILRQHVEDELARERGFLKTLIATIPDLIWLKDPHGVYLACNPRFEQFFGAREADIVGKTDYDFVPKELAEFFRQHDRQAIEKGEISINEEEVTFANDGHSEQLETTKAPMRDAAGRILGVLGIGHDMTAHKQLNAVLESERSRLHNIIEGTSEGFWLINADWRTLGTNAALSQMLGYPREEILGRFPYEFADETNQAIFQQHWQLATTNHQSYEIELRTRAGINLPTRFNATTLRDTMGQFEVAFAFVTDMRPYKTYEQQLIQAKLDAEAANRAKSAFIANMSHELRTPLNAVLGFAQILLQSPSLDNHQRDHVQRIQRGGEYLLTLINDILDLAKIEAGRFELFPTVWNTQAVFQELSDMFRIRAEQKHINFQYEPVTPLPQSLYSDDKRLRQILINLLGNAVKFTERGTVTLRTGYEAGTLCLEVLDNGIGIATEDLHKIFQPFQQTGTDRYKAQGTGLGLAITHRLVKTMGGTLQVYSTLGQGSVFRVELPAEVVSTATEAQPLVDQPKILGYRRSRDNTPARGVISPDLDDGVPVRILVVDDLEDNRQVVRHLLEPLGFQVAEAKNGQHCLDLVPNYQPDVIFMDLRMPELDGLETTRALRAQGFERPIIVLSASVLAEDHTASLEAGCTANLAKPVRLAELLDTLAQWLRLEWEYADVPTSKALAEAGPLETLTAAEAEQLRQLTLLGDVMAMREFIGQLATNYPQLGQTLNKLVKAFDFEKILEVVEKCS